MEIVQGTKVETSMLVDQPGLFGYYLDSKNRIWVFIKNTQPYHLSHHPIP